MYPESNSLDYTGYGPAGSGFSPTAGQRFDRRMDQFQAQRMAMAMGFIDPYVHAAGMTAQQIVAKANSPDAARHSLYSTAGGQSARDIAMLGRITGKLGQGDPITYGMDMLQGVAAGGFNMSVGGSIDGQRLSGANQRVSGTGLLQERVSMSFAKNMLEDLYGKGMPDPRKLQGFKMDDASYVFRKIASRGGVGDIAHLEQNADVNTKLAAARESALNPKVKDALSKISVGGPSLEQYQNMSAEDQQKVVADQTAQLEKIIETTDDEELKKALEDVKNSTGALFLNRDAQQKVAEVVESTIDGLAALKDIYGDLGAPALMAKLEEISGTQITNKAQAKSAKAMVDRLSQSALVADRDPMVAMEMSEKLKAGFSARMGAALGFDERNTSANLASTSAVHNKLYGDAMVQAKDMENTAANMREMGLDPGETKTAEEIYADKVQGMEQFANRFQGSVMAKGLGGKVNKSQQKELDAMLKRFEEAPNEEKDNVDQEIRQYIQGIMSADGVERDWNAIWDSGAGKSAKRQTLAKNTDWVTGRMTADREDDIMQSMSINTLNGMGVQDSAGIMEQLRKNVGPGALSQMMKNAKSSLTPEEKKEQNMKLLQQSGMSEEEINNFYNQFFDEKGTMKDQEGMNQLMTNLNDAMWEGDNSVLGRSREARDRMAIRGKASKRAAMSDGDKGVSINSILTSMVAGTTDGITDQESAALAIQALGDAAPVITDEQGNKIDFGKETAGGINFKDGLTQEGLDKLARVNGGDLKLHEKVMNPLTNQAFGSMEELIKASQKDGNVLEASMNALEKDYDFGLFGGMENLTAMSDSSWEAVKKNNKIDDQYQRMATVKRLSGMLSGNEESDMMEKARTGKDLGLADHFQVAAFEGIDDRKNWWPGKADKDGNLVTVMGNKLGTIDNLKREVLGAEGGELSGLAKINENGDLTDAMQKQYDELVKAKEAGATVAEFSFGDESRTMKLDDASLKEFKKAIDKLKEATAQEKGSQVVQEVVVQGNIQVQGSIEPK